MVGGLRFRGWRRKDGAVRDFLVDSKLPPRRALNLGKKRERERERDGERESTGILFSRPHVRLLWLGGGRLLTIYADAALNGRAGPAGRAE